MVDRTRARSHRPRRSRAVQQRNRSRARHQRRHRQDACQPRDAQAPRARPGPARRPRLLLRPRVGAVSTQPARDELPRPALHALSGGAAAEPSDREMIEGTVAALALFSAKWKVDLIFLLAAGVRRHGRLNDHLLVSKKVLSEALKSLERDGLVKRQVFAEMPVRVEYSLTPLGRSLTGPLYAI